MPDFEFRKQPVSKKPVILAPRRSKRTNTGKKPAEICPFCPGQEENEEELYRVQAKGTTGSTSTTGTKGILDSNWAIRVIPNRFPFTPHHEIIIHSPDHHKNFDELPFEQVELIFQTYRQRFHTHEHDGQVYLFHNRGHAAGESLPHPHTQLTVVPTKVQLDIPPLDTMIYTKSGKLFGKSAEHPAVIETDHFFIFCPETSDWPDEVWVAPKVQDRMFCAITDAQVTDLAFVVSRLIQIYDIRHGFEFPFNFYISPGRNWYLRLIPRLKILGGFELGTNVIVNTQDPKETFFFIKEHFWKPDSEKIKAEHQAEYLKSV